MDYPIIDLTEAGFGPVCVLYASLRQHPEFRRHFGDHAHRLLLNHGALTPERSAARWMKRAQEIDSAIIAESLRWGITNWWAFPQWVGLKYEAFYARRLDCGTDLSDDELVPASNGRFDWPTSRCGVVSYVGRADFCAAWWHYP